jgi:hypothetical protein
MRDGLEEDTLRVLRRVRDGTQAFFRDRLEVAYLIARECVEADMEEHSLTITKKGLDALEFFDTDKPWEW